MYTKQFLVCFLGIILICTAHSRAGVPPAEETFNHYLDQALSFAKAYPREKAYLHFDNTSYYVGDTIWFKAYVTLSEELLPTPISRPLYVELADQTGHIVEKQIIKITDGEGHGQFILPASSILSGYYEIRAFTRWMLGFDEQTYFSRTFPVYLASKGEKPERSITTYQLNPSMQQRPEKKEKFTLRFFPEGGQLVKAVPTQVAFKAESSTEANVKMEGTICNANGNKIGTLQTLHDGMGRFEYTPDEKPAIAKVTYKGKQYQFKLPEALPAGYVLNVTNKPGGLAIQVSCNNETPRDTLAVFMSHQGQPFAYQLISCTAEAPGTFLIRTKDIPAGVLQISLINREGATLCTRFSFVTPKSQLRISTVGLKPVYTPYAPIQCQLRVTDAAGRPIETNLSVSIRDAVRSDYLEYDNNIYTDLLLTSDLKGYIHQPGYYFAGTSLQKQAELDILLMVHGWRKYDMSQLIGTKSFSPLQTPETKLILHGQVKSLVQKNELKDIAVSVMAKTDSVIIAGSTVTNGQGHFEIPVEDFENTMEAIFQTKREGKDRKKMASILIDRNFSPNLRSYEYTEWNPQWKDVSKWIQNTQQTDSLYLDSIRQVDNLHLLNTVEVVAKRRKNATMETHIYQQSLDAYYDIRQSVDRLRDEGKEIYTLPELFEKLTPFFRWNKQDDTYSYKQKPICFFLGGRMLTSIEATSIMTEVDGLQSIYICEGANAFSAGAFKDAQVSSLENGPRDFDHEERVNVTELSKYAVFYLTALPLRDIANKQQQAARGTRQTIIQGYNRPLEFYSPIYKDTDAFPPVQPDQRRTLYWNSSVRTDSEGKATIECYNSNYSAPLIISAETISNGVTGTLTYSTLEHQ